MVYYVFQLYPYTCVCVCYQKTITGPICLLFYFFRCLEQLLPAVGEARVNSRCIYAYINKFIHFYLDTCVCVCVCYHKHS